MGEIACKPTPSVRSAFCPKLDLRRVGLVECNWLEEREDWVVSWCFAQITLCPYVADQADPHP